MILKLVGNIVLMLVFSGAATLFSLAGDDGFDLGSPEGLGQFLGRVTAATLIPLVVAAIPAGLYWAWKKRRMPGFFLVIWVLWILLSLMPVLSKIGGMKAG